MGPSYSIWLEVEILRFIFLNYVLVEKNGKAFLIKSFCVSIPSRFDCFLLCKTLWYAIHRSITAVHYTLRSCVKKHKIAQVSK